MSSMSEVYYGFYSAKADEMFGHVVYLNSEGQEVKITYATKDPLIGYYQYLFEDKQFVGPLDKLVASKTKNNKKYDAHWREPSQWRDGDIVYRKRILRYRERF